MTQTASIIAGRLPDGRAVLLAAKWVVSDGRTIQQLNCTYKQDASSGSPWVDWTPFEYIALASPGTLIYDPSLGTIVRGGPGRPMSLFVVDDSGHVWWASASLSDNTPEYSQPDDILWQRWITCYEPGDPTEDPAVSGLAAASIAAATMSDGTMQVYISGLHQQVYDSAGIQPPPDPGKQLVVAVVDDSEPFDATPFYPQMAPGMLLGRLMAATRSDGKIQIWGTDGNGAMWTSMQTAPEDPDAGWTNWTLFPVPFIAAHWGGNNAIATLPDGRLQLWAVSTESEGVAPGAVYSCWQFPPGSPVEWHDWVPDWNRHGTLRALSLAVAPLSDNRLQFWALKDVNGNIVTTWKVDQDPDADWTPWSNFFAP